MKIMHVIQRGAASFLVLLTAQACGQGVQQRRRTREPVPPISTATAAQVSAAFAELSARHRSASARGALTPQACEQLATAFKRLHDGNRGRPEIHGVERAWFNAAVVRQECGELERAVDAYQAIAAAYPKFDLPRNNLGVILWNRGDKRGAVAQFEGAIAANPRTTVPRTNLAAVLHKQYARSRGEQAFVAAESQVQSALAVDAGDMAAYENLARLYYERGRRSDRSYLLLAGLVVTQALRLAEDEAPRRADLHNLRGLLKIEDGDQVSALRSFRKAVEVDASHRDAHLNLAMVAIRFRDYAQAERSLVLVAAAAKQPAGPDVYLGLGVAQRGLAKYDAAKRSFEKAAKLGRSDARPFYNLGILYQEHIATHADGKALEENEQAKRYFVAFIAKADHQSELRTAVADARRRVTNIDDYARSVKEMEELERKAHAAAAAKAKAAAQRHRELLEMERRARTAAADQI